MSQRPMPPGAIPAEPAPAGPATEQPTLAQPPSPRRLPNAPLAAIVDLRQRQPWRRRLPARLGTAALWLGSLSLLGPLKLAGVLALSASLLPSALVFDSLRRQRGDTPQLLQAAPTTATLPWQLARAEVAEQFCLAETLLFQARHARICTVVYDSEGRLAELLLPNPAAPMQAVASPIKVGSAAGAFHSRGEIHATLASRVDQPLTTSTPDAHLAG